MGGRLGHKVKKYGAIGLKGLAGLGAVGAMVLGGKTAADYSDAASMASYNEASDAAQAEARLAYEAGTYALPEGRGGLMGEIDPYVLSGNL